MNITSHMLSNDRWILGTVIAFLLVITAIDISTQYFPLLLTLATFSVFLFLLFLNKPEWGLLCTVASLPISSIVILEGAGITKIVGLIAFPAWLATKLVGNSRPRSINNWQTVCLVGFLLVSVASYLSGGDRDTLNLLLRIFLGLGLFLFTSDVIRSWKSLERILLVLVLVGIFVSILNIILFKMGFQGTSMHSTVGVSVDRIQGMGYAPNNLAKLSLVLLTLATFLPFPRQFHRLRWIGVGILFLIMTLTYSRAAFVTLSAVLTTYAFYHREKRALLIPLLLGAVFFLLVPDTYLERISSIFTPQDQGLRPILWRASVIAIAQKPFFGWGLGQSTYAIFDQGMLPLLQDAHNTPLDLLLSLGVVGFIPFALAALLGVYYLFRSMRIAGNRIKSDEYSCLKSIFYAYIAYWGAAMFMVLTYDPLLYFIMALSLVALRLVQVKKIREPYLK